jgi:Ser-tRNA(Ala) deacylase AlaX
MFQRIVASWRNSLSRDMSTKLVYLSDTFKFSFTGAKVLQVITLTNDEAKREQLDAILLDSTIFHPQGGGQPSDTGIIYTDNITFNVQKVDKQQDGTVLHIGEFNGDERFQDGQLVDLKIDEESRVLNARCHSAGHLLDLALDDLGIALQSIKGYHFPKSGSYVEYSGNIPADQRDKVVAQLQEKLDELVTQDIPVQVITLESQQRDELTLHCRETDLPKNCEQLSNVRIVKFQGRMGCPCGGTHVQRSGQIGKITGLKLQKKGANIRIKYTVS